MKKKKILAAIMSAAMFVFNTGCTITTSESENNSPTSSSGSFSAGNGGGLTVDDTDIPAYSGEPFVVLKDNYPDFYETSGVYSFEEYSPLDKLGRCGPAYASLSRDTMPADGEQRGSISSVKPSGWINKEYDNVDGKYLYNRCHLIGWQLSAENANEKNLITGTRYLNVEGMLPFENMVADYIKETDNHVLYRVTPWYDGDNLVASGVQMEAVSVEDSGGGICFNVYCYNVQPGISIDYATGESRLDKEGNVSANINGMQTYILNTNSKKFHYESCDSASKTSEKNKEVYKGSREDIIAQGYDPCGVCKP